MQLAKFTPEMESQR